MAWELVKPQNNLLQISFELIGNDISATLHYAAPSLQNHKHAAVSLIPLLSVMGSKGLYGVIIYDVLTFAGQFTAGELIGIKRLRFDYAIFIPQFPKQPGQQTSAKMSRKKWGKYSYTTRFLQIYLEILNEINALPPDTPSDVKITPNGNPIITNKLFL